MTDVQAAQAMLDEAEREAREQLLDESSYLNEWARDRLRLVERDRRTLAVHEPTHVPGYEHAVCGNCSCQCQGPLNWPCDDAQAVLDFWLDGTREATPDDWREAARYYDDDPGLLGGGTREGEAK